MSGVKNLKTKKQGVLVIIFNKTNGSDFINTCCHEGFHVAADILHYRDVVYDVNNQEPFAYVAGWAAECIYKTVKEK